jgi:2-hydroxy-3-keto-5-methylthiopentenyl-1-phosphate phosphatase
MCTSSFSSVIESFGGNCSVFDEYDDLASYLVYYRDNLEDLHRKRLKSFEFARRNLIWEKFEENLFRAYQIA